MYIAKFAGGLVVSSTPLGVFDENLVFRIQARFTQHPSMLIKDGGPHYQLEKIINTDQLDARTFAMCLEEFADEVRDLADEHEDSSSS